MNLFPMHSCSIRVAKLRDGPGRGGNLGPVERTWLGNELAMEISPRVTMSEARLMICASHCAGTDAKKNARCRAASGRCPIIFGRDQHTVARSQSAPCGLS